MAMLSIRGLHKRFGDKEVLRGLDLTVPERSIFGFIGKNGAGKTTAMKTVLGLLRADAGRITVAGETVAYGQTATNRFIGYLPDVPEFYPFMTAPEYLRFCGEITGMESGAIARRSGELLELVGLAGETHRIKGYSRGMKQRLGIAQALLASPQLLICDEPTSALDPIGRKEILDILVSVKQDTTVLFSTHILSDVERICTDVALLHDGRIAMQGSVEEMMRLRRGDHFTVEMTDPHSAERLHSFFPQAGLTQGDTLTFAGGDDLLYEVMACIRIQTLSLRRIERGSASLESLFVEVVKS